VFRAVVVDAVLVLAVLWVSVTFYGMGGVGEIRPYVREPDWLGLALIVLSALPLSLRRRAPLAALALTAAASVALAALRYGVVIHLGPAVALYTIGARSPRPSSGAVLAIAIPAFVAIALADVVLLHASEDHVVEGIVWLGAWLVGDRARLARERRAAALERADREARLAAAEERGRIARELHDSAGHAINAILLQAGAARVLREREPDRAWAALETIEEVARETIGDIDRLVGELRDDEPGAPAPLAGVADLDRLVERHGRGGLAVALERRGRPRRLAPALDRAAYRIVQEALTNASRHGAGRAELVLEFGADALELSVTNPLTAGTPPSSAGGRGIIGMRERATLLGGELDASRDGGLFRVRARLRYERAVR
jgi:signal transduction histidine kinase